MAHARFSLRSALLLALFASSFSAAASFLRKLTPWPNEYGQRAKWEYFERHKDEFDALFFGSSVTFYGLIPRSFDRLVGERGIPLQSFNFGVGGMTPLEADQLLRRVLDLRPARLKYVFVEAENWDARIWHRKNTYAPRMVHWHSLEHTKLALQSLWRAPNPPFKDEGRFWRLHESWTHLGLCLRKYTNAGQGKRIAGSLFGFDRQEVLPTPEELEREHGYVELDHITGQEWVDRRADFLAKLEAYRERVGRIDAQNAAEVSISSHFNLAGLASQIAAIRAAGAEPIYYTGPRVLEAPLERALARAGVLPTFLPFNQPARYPALYDPENHFDQNHLKRSGAEEFTRLFAESFVAHLETTQKQ